MADFPERVQINEKNIEKVTTFYKRAYQEIVDEIQGATKFGKNNRRAILQQIEKILTELGVDSQELVKQELPKYYKTGADQAVEQLKSINANVAVSTGFNKVHKEAILAIIDDSAKAIAESISGVGRSASRLLNTAVKEELKFRLAAGETSGEALEQTKKKIKGVLQDEGLSALTDKSGRKWELDRYTEMLIRTKGVEARNTGLVNRLIENGYDLVQVSAHGATDVCESWEGKILSATGQTKGYPTVADAESDGLFHPNCKHAINVIVLDLAKETMGWNPKTQEYEKGLL